MDANKLLIVVSHSPRNSSIALESLDAALTACLLGVETSLLFVDEGIEVLQDHDGRKKLATINSMGNITAYANDPNGSEYNIATDPSQKNDSTMHVSMIEDAKVKCLFQEHQKILSC